jgi:hypothetical protein
MWSRFNPLTARPALCVWALCGSAAVQAAGLNAQERLEAVRQELLQATLQGATQVQSTAWVDAQGALREASSFKHGMQVRGVRVLSYQRDADGQPRAQVEWQGKQDAAKPGPLAQAPVPLPAGSSSPAKPAACAPEGKLKHVLSLRLSVPSRSAEPDAHVFEDARQSLAEGWALAGESARHWRLLQQTPNLPEALLVSGSSAAYLRLLTAGPAAVQPAWVAHMRLEPLPSASGSWFKWWEAPSPRMRLSLVVSAADGAAVFQTRTDLPMAVQTSRWAAPRLSPASQEALAQVVVQWSEALSERLACQPVKVQVLQSQADRVQVDQGSMAGMRVGEEWLISDRQRVPQRLLEPGAAQAMVLARVERVDVQRAELKVLAGPTEQVRPQWQAWPVQAP